MPGEEKATGSNLRSAQGAKQTKHDVAEVADARRTLLKWMVRVSVATNVLAIGWQVFFYLQERSWHMLAMPVSSLVAIACLLLADRAVRRGKLDVGGYWLLFSMVFSYGAGQLLFGDSTGFVMVSVFLVTLIGGSVALPRRWGILLGTILLFGLYAWLVDRFEPVPRYYPEERTILTPIAWMSGTVIYLVVVVWQIARAYSTATIRVRLIVTFVSVVLLVAVAVGVSAVVVGLNSARQQAYRQLESVATLKKSEVDTWVDALELDLDATLTEEYELQRARIVLLWLDLMNPQDARVTLRRRFQELRDRAQRFEEIFMINLQGEVMVSTDPTQEGQLHGDTVYFERGLQGPYVHPPAFYPSVGKMSVMVVRPIADDYYGLMGVLVGRVSLDRFNDVMLERAGLGETGETYLVNADHTLLTEVRGIAQVGYLVRSEGIDTVLTARKTGQGMYVGYKENVPVLGYYTWLPKLQVALVAEQEVDEVTRGAQVTFLLDVGVAVASVLLAVVASVFFARGISNPLADLSATAARIAGGDIELTAEVVREDEIGALARAFNSMTAQLRELIGSLEQRVAERTSGLEAVAEVSRATTSVLDPEQLLPQIVDLVRERFGLYYVGLFLVDDAGRSAVLRAGTGEAGQQMMAQGWSLPVGGESMIGQCVASGEAGVGQSVGDTAARFENPLLPDTRSELALPLRSRGRVIGAMTVQSAVEAAFDETYIALLQNMADQVAVSVENARLFADTQAALERVQEVHQRYLGEAWAKYTRAQAISGYELNEDGMSPLGSELLPEAQKAVEERYVADGVSQSVLVRPIVQGDRVVAALGFEKKDEEWSADDVALIDAVAEQLGQTSETLRLLDQIQRRAARDRTIGEITARMGMTLDLDTVLQTAAREMREALNLARVKVRLEIGGEG